MKKIHFAVLLVFFLVPIVSMAEWEKVTKNDTGDFFVEKTRIKGVGGKRFSAWVLLNYRDQAAAVESIGSGDIWVLNTKSKISKVIADCKNGEVGTASLYFYSEKNAEGYVTKNVTMSLMMQEQPPRSVGEFLLSNICIIAATGKTAKEIKNFEESYGDKDGGGAPKAAPFPVPNAPRNKSKIPSFEEFSKSLGVSS